MNRYSWFGALLLSPFATATFAAEDSSCDTAWRASIEQALAILEYQVVVVDRDDLPIGAEHIGLRETGTRETGALVTGTRETGTLQAVNRAQDLRITFTPEGVVAQPRTERDANFRWGLSLRGIGRGERLEEPAVGKPAAKGNRVEVRRGDLVEWYVNDPRGLEHGFTLEARPAGTGEIVVELEVTGTLTPTQRADASNSVEFTTKQGEAVLCYDHLYVFDADGVTLAATMVPIGNTVRITVDDRAARYPVTIDPLATSPAWTAESDQATSNFGTSVASAGDVNGDGYFDVLVGAPYFDNPHSNEGRLFVFLGSAAGLATTPASTAESNKAETTFGTSVASAGDINGDGYSDVVVGAPTYTNDQNSEGRAYVYLGSANGLAASPAWSIESNQSISNYGFSVASAGDVNGDGATEVIVSAPNGTFGQDDEGRANLYSGSVAGLATTTSWTAESNQVGGNFGRSVASAGDVNGDGFSDVVVGAPKFDAGQTNEGRAYIYLGSATGLVSSASWTVDGEQNGANLGVSVATAGDVNGDGFADVIVGADGFNAGQVDEGRVYLHMGSASGPATTPTWFAESDRTAAAFGASVAPAGDVNGDGFADVILGAPLFEKGRAFVYLGSATGLAGGPARFVEADQFNSFFAICVAGAGDVNGDGLSDVVVGAPFFTNGQTTEGGAFVYLGTSAFVPGDRLFGTFTAAKSQIAAMFDGVDGMKVTLNFQKTQTPMTMKVRWLAANGDIVKTVKIETGKKKVKKSLTLPHSGPFTLRFEFVEGTPGPFEVRTNRTLPAAAASTVKTLKPKKGQSAATLTLLALPGAILGLTLQKKAFAGAIGIAMTRPDGTSFDVSTFQTTAVDGAVTLDSVPCNTAGAYTLTVSGYGNDQETVKAKVTLTQPEKGRADLVLP